ncbi:unnamed protein product [Calicophoron daubneyi]|uniref:Uncharacterized protein n=1 Tax=Calicophoron daubneyi TaxID=300641 RepID=A0AAV2TLM8_CALDB
MDQCEAHQAFDSLWSVTDEIFKHVADIRTTLNVAKCPVSEILPTDTPSYENREKHDEHASAILRDNALKNLVSYTSARHAALKTNLDLLEQASQKLSEFRNELLETNTIDGDPIRGCSPYAEWVFNNAMNISEGFNSHLSEDRATLLKEGKMLEESILKVSHETSEETSKVIKNVQDSYLRIKNADLSTFGDQISPILKEYLETQTRFAMRNTVNSVVINMQHSFNEYTQMVQTYNQALQSLANHLII